MKSRYFQKYWLTLLIIGFVLAIYICYYFSFAKTIQQYEEYKKFETILSKIPNYKRSSLKYSPTEIASKFQRYKLDSINSSSSLLSAVTNYCAENELNLIEYRPAGKKLIQNFSIYSRLIAVEGNFNECLKLIYFFERKVNLGRVAAVEFKLINEIQKSNISSLQCLIVIENINDYE